MMGIRYIRFLKVPISPTLQRASVIVPLCYRRIKKRFCSYDCRFGFHRVMFRCRAPMRGDPVRPGDEFDRFGEIDKRSVKDADALHILSSIDPGYCGKLHFLSI